MTKKMAKKQKILVLLLVTLNLVTSSLADHEVTKSLSDITEVDEHLLRSSEHKLKLDEATNRSSVTDKIKDEENAEVTSTEESVAETESTTTETSHNVETATAKDEVAKETEAPTEKIKRNDIVDGTTITTAAVTESDAIEETTEGVKQNLVTDRIDNVDHVTTEGMKKIKTDAPSTTEAATNKPNIMPKTTQDEGVTSGSRSPKADDGLQAPVEKPTTSSAASTLAAWLSDGWLRRPSAALLPLRSGSLTHALPLWRAVGDASAELVLLLYRGHGIVWKSRHSLMEGHSGGGVRSVTETLSKLLVKSQASTSRDTTPDATLRALTASTKYVPYDSAIFLFADKPPSDPELLPMALKALVEKRLKVYTIWTDPLYPSKESELALSLYRNITAHTEGDILVYSQSEDLDNITKSPGEPEEPRARSARLDSMPSDEYETLLVKRGGGGAMSLGVPVEVGVTALKVYIEGAVEHAVLYPPNDGPQIDLYNETSVENFSPGSKTDGASPREVFLLFPGAKPKDRLAVLPMATSTPDDSLEPNAGIWHLSMRCDTCDYRLTMCAVALIRFDAELTDNGGVRMRVAGPAASVRESALVDEYGTEIGKLDFSYEPSDDKSDAETNELDRELVAEVPLPALNGSKVYARVVGRDLHGQTFVRLSGPLVRRDAPSRVSRSASVAFPSGPANDLERAEIYSQRAYDNRFRHNDTDILPNNRAVSQVVNQRGSLMTTVQIGLSTRIYGAPGNNLQLHFEVTNYRDQSVIFRFEAIGELRFLRGISPASQTIGSGQTANVIVSVGVTSTAQPGARDLITFTAYGLEQVSISTYVYVTNPDTVVSDIWAPSLRHTFQGSCIGNMGDDCDQHVWSALITARDNVGGLLRLSSSPTGLLYDSNFIAGTREEVTASYRASCCAPRAMITAIDALGNANSYIVDISTYFTPASIAAIVLGVLLLIALIALVVFLIYWCVRRSKESRELPSYTTRRDIS